MAFGGILLLNLIFIVLLIDFILFVISLIIFIVSLILSLKNKTKKGRKIVKIVFGILTIVFLIPLLVFGIFINEGNKEKISYNGKKYKIKEEIIDKFHSEIAYCDTTELNKYLKKHPELINSHDFEGSLPLGVSIKYKKMECIKYFINKNVDVNTVSSNSEFGTFEYMFYYGYYNEEIVEYLLSQDGIDINKRHLAMPVAQLYIKQIIKDKEISAKELEIFEKMLNKGLDLKQTNGTNTNTYEYVNSVSDEVINISELRKVVENNKK